MKRIFTYCSLIVIISATVLTGAEQAFAEGINDLNNQISDLKDEKKNIEKEANNIGDKKSDTEKQIEEVQARQQQANNEIQKMSKSLAETQSQLQKKQEEITETNKTIETTKTEITKLITHISDLEDRIAVREELLKNRLRTLQENGGDISYFQVLLGAKSFGDFLNRISAVSQIMQQDKNIIETNNKEKIELENNKTSLEAKQIELEDKMVALEEQQKELESLKASLDRQIDEREKLVAELEIEEEHLEEITVTLAMEQEVLKNEKAALDKAIKQAEQKKKQLEQLTEQKKNNGSTSSSSGGNGFFGWPAGATYVSSGFGWRWGDLHKGIDIAAGGTVPIYAAEDGVVSMVKREDPYRTSGWWSYGNFVMITHWLNGQQYTTVYAHMRSSNVSLGQSVTRGQQIGIMGNTGNSFGQHLHFELHKGGYASDSSAINPIPYLK